MIIRRREIRLQKSKEAEKEKIAFQFETLKTQVNPHFLFNSFNTLITVIENNPKLATEYVEHLSQFFRNIISYQDKDIISLSEELKILESYIFIQTKRYGKNLTFSNTIKPDIAESCFIPPLTLQILAENALKHNAISHESILRIELFYEEDYIVVKNNINPKFSVEDSTAIGIQNILNRYKLLGYKNIKVEHSTEYFIVSVPIIQTKNL